MGTRKQESFCWRDMTTIAQGPSCTRKSTPNPTTAKRASLKASQQRAAVVRARLTPRSQQTRQNYQRQKENAEKTVKRKVQKLQLTTIIFGGSQVCTKIAKVVNPAL